MTCHSRSGVLTRSTLCFAKRFSAAVRISLADPLPLGAAALWIEVRWTPAAPEGKVELAFRRLSATAADVHFFAADGPTTFTLTGDILAERGLRRIVGVTPSAGTQADLLLDVKVDGDLAGEAIPVLVRSASTTTGDAGLAALRSELTAAAAATRPGSDGAIWDRYNDLFVQGRALAAALAAQQFPAATLPATGPVPANATPRTRTLARDEVVAALQTNADRSGSAADRARCKSSAFDAFQGQWRGPLLAHNGCSHVAIFQDHDRRAAAPLAQGSDIYLQPALAAADSRPYVEPPVDAQSLSPGRDVDTAASFAINVTTGVLVGAIGAQAQPVEGLRAQRPMIGFFLGDGRLLWLAEDARSGSLSTFSLFEESAAPGDDGLPQQTVTGLTFSWDRTQQRLTTPLTPFAAILRPVLTPAEAALARDFAARQLRSAHLADMRFRRQLEGLDPAAVEQFLANADDSTRDYLTRLLDFVCQQQALAAAPLGDRTSVTFIMGEDDPADPNKFYTGATAFFELHPAGRLITHLRTLQAVRTWLDDNRPADGKPWGEVNIVVHASEEGGMTIPVVPVPAGEDPAFNQANPNSLLEAMNNHGLDPLADAVLDVRSTLMIRGCALGQNPQMVTLLSKAFGGDETQRPIVRAPKHLQGFSYTPNTWTTNDTSPPTSSDFYYAEFWFVGFPANHRPNNATLIDMFNAKYPGAGINWATGLATVGPPSGDRLSNETRERRYRLEVAITYFPLPANNAALAATVAATGFFPPLSNVQETGRSPAAEGRTRVDFSGVQNNGNGFTGHLDMGPNPPANDAARLAVVSTDAATIAALARVGHVVADYDFTFVQNDANSGNNDGTRVWTLVATGRHTVLRIQRELREPDPTRPGSTRRLLPPVTDLTHFGEELPARPAAKPLGENVAP